MNFRQRNRRFDVHIGIGKDFQYFIRLQFLVCMVGNTLDQIAKRFPHTCRNIESITSFHQVANTALARLAVDTNDICFVNSADIVWV